MRGTDISTWGFRVCCRRGRGRLENCTERFSLLHPAHDTILSTHISLVKTSNLMPLTARTPRKFSFPCVQEGSRAEYVAFISACLWNSQHIWWDLKIEKMEKVCKIIVWIKETTTGCSPLCLILLRSKYMFIHLSFYILLIHHKSLYILYFSGFSRETK